MRVISLIFLFTLVKEPKDYLKFAMVMTLPEITAKIVDFMTVRSYLVFDIRRLNLKKHLKPLIIIFFMLFQLMFI